MLTAYWRRPWLERRLDPAWTLGFSGGSRLPVDVREDDEAYHISAAVPGLKAEQVEIQVLDDVVTLRVRSKAEADESPAYLLREIHEGDRERSFRLPAPVDATKAEAVVENGLLRLDLPKADEVRPKSIRVTGK